MAERASRTPALFVAFACLATAFFALPLIGLLQRVPWADIWGDLTAPETLDALRLSLVCSVAATLLAITFGIPLAWVLARRGFRGRSLVRALTLLPMVLPPVVGGVALLFVFGRRGLVGEPLYELFGVQFTFSTIGVVLAETFVAMPFLVVTVEAALRSADHRYEDVATTLGASPSRVFRTVTFPAIAPAVAAGAALAWARALGEFGATITFAGNVEGRTRTAPLAVYLALESRPEAAIALSLVMLCISFGVLVLLRDRWFVRT
jgi:molybdate transport system permease protein